MASTRRACPEVSRDGAGPWRAPLAAALALALIGCSSHQPPPTAAEPPAPALHAPADARVWYVRALHAEARGELAGAELALAWVTRFDGENPYAWVARARFFERQSRAEDAREAFARALALQPRLPAAQGGMGRLARDAGDLAGARTWLEAAAAQGHVESMGPLIEVLLDLGDRPAATAVLETWLRVPEEEAQRRRRVALAFRVGQASLAVEDLLWLVWTRPQLADADALWSAAVSACRWVELRSWAQQQHVAAWGGPWSRWALRTARQLQDREMEAAAVAALADEDPLSRATWLLREGDPAGAREALSGTEGPAAALLRAQATLRLGDPRGARRLVDSVAPGSPEVERTRVELLLALADRQVARRVLAEREVADAPWLEARLAADEGRWDDAEALLRAWAREEQVAWWLARLYREAGRTDRALAVLEDAARAGSLQAAREVAAQQGSHDRALPWWRLVLGLDPSDVDALVAVARADEDRRVALLETALARDPCHLGALLEMARDRPPCEALPWLERAHAASPVDAAAMREVTRARATCGGPR